MTETSKTAKTIRWGIIATGGISQSFSTDLLIDPATRDEHSIKHSVVAVGSRSAEKATKFIEDNKLGAQAKGYGTYQEVYNHPDVDIVYIGSPHSHHFENARDALNAGKNVLCEKAFTVNCEQAEALIALAKQKNVFLMEAMWTRYFPVSKVFQQLIQNGKIGTVQRVFSDFSIDFNPFELDPSHRLVDPNLAGGALLDLGPYALNWILLSLFPHPAPIGIPTVSAQQTLYKGADLHSSAILTFPETNGAVGFMTTSMAQTGPQTLVQGTEGSIELIGPPYRPLGFIVRYKDEKKEEERHEYPMPEKGGGMFWEADEAARCVAAGKKESERMPHAHSISIMKIFDEIRRQGGHRYPDAIERL